MPLDRLWRDRAAALVFLRHYLCVQCRVGAMELERDRDLLPPDPNVWLIGMGTAVQARAFKQQTGVRFPVLLFSGSVSLRGDESAARLAAADLWDRGAAGGAASREARRPRSAGRGWQPPQGPARTGLAPARWSVRVRARRPARGSHRARHAGDNPDHRLLGEALRDAEDRGEA